MFLRRSEPAGTATAPPVTELPGVNMLVRLIGPDGQGDPAGLPSRVEDVDAPAPGRPVRFRVVVPDYPGDLVDPGPDDEWVFTWVSERGRWELPVRREDADGPGPRCWWLTPCGPLRRNQRRSFHRVGCATTLAVDVLAEPFGTIVGRTLDVSEGGVRCLLPGAGLEAGTRVLVRLSLDEFTGTLAGVVRRSRRPVRTVRVAGWHREVVVAFDDPELHGDALRRVVVRWELRARHLAPPRPR